MPRSSSFTATPAQPVTRTPSRRRRSALPQSTPRHMTQGMGTSRSEEQQAQRTEVGRTVTGPPHLSNSELPVPQGWFYFGTDGEVIGILPLMMSALIASSSVFTLAGTLESKLWNGARPVPL